MWNLLTLDGYFEGAKSWELDWHEYVWGEELERLSIACMVDTKYYIEGSPRPAGSVLTVHVKR
jgi:hypothetical protein